MKNRLKVTVWAHEDKQNFREISENQQARSNLPQSLALDAEEAEERARRHVESHGGQRRSPRGEPHARADRRAADRRDGRRLRPRPRPRTRARRAQAQEAHKGADRSAGTRGRRARGAGRRGGVRGAADPHAPDDARATGDDAPNRVPCPPSTHKRRPISPNQAGARPGHHRCANDHRRTSATNSDKTSTSSGASRLSLRVYTNAVGGRTNRQSTPRSRSSTPPSESNCGSTITPKTLTPRNSPKNAPCSKGSRPNARKAYWTKTRSKRCAAG